VTLLDTVSVMTTDTGPDVFGDAFRTDPYPFYDAMRRESPVRPVELPTGRAWIVTRYADARQALADPRLSKNLVLGNVGASYGPPLPPEHRRLADHMLNYDPPVHTRLRRLVAKVFTPARIEALRPRVREIAEDLAATIAARGEGDLVGEFAFPLPLTVICEMLGVPMEDRDSFRAWSNAVVAGTIARTDMADVGAALATYITGLVAAKRASRGNDLLSDLIAVTEEGDRLSEDELVGMVFLLLVAGHETTVNLIGNGMYLLLTHPGQHDRLRADRSLLPAAVEEFLRYESPVATSTPRFTTGPVELGGVTIPAGELVLVALASANRDAERFPDADAFDVGRFTSGRADSAHHIAFGHGIHFCLGAPLARLEGQVAFEAILTLLPDVRLAVPVEELSWRRGLLMRGLTALPVRTGTPPGP
jgi:cytochrome P450